MYFQWVTNDSMRSAGIRESKSALLSAGLTAQNQNVGMGAEEKRKHYTFWRHFNEQPSTISGCPAQVLR